jgi:hypothetical protein
MGHYLDPLLDQVKAKYSADTQDAYRTGWDEGADYVERLVAQFAHDKQSIPYDLFHELLNYLKSRPII